MRFAARKRRRHDDRRWSSLPPDRLFALAAVVLIAAATRRAFVTESGSMRRSPGHADGYASSTPRALEPLFVLSNASLFALHARRCGGARRIRRTLRRCRQARGRSCG
jgi:hypothetical protein